MRDPRRHLRGLTPRRILPRLRDSGAGGGRCQEPRGEPAKAKGGSLVALDPNPIDAIWADRPPPPAAAATAKRRQAAARKAAPAGKSPGRKRAAAKR